MEEWEKYSVGFPSADPKWDNDDCSPLNTIFHISHLESGLRILKDGQISRRLIYDESRLTPTRTQVVWFSPNNWWKGSRYGNVSFKFDWRKLWNGRKAFWVEAITKYNPHAPRILITNNDYSQMLKPYDPTKRYGPWWYDAGADNHYWHSKLTLEILLDEDVPLNTVMSLSFEKHHENMCSLKTVCYSWGLSEANAGLSFLAEVIADEGRIDRGPRLSKTIPPVEPNAFKNFWSNLFGALPRPRPQWLGLAMTPQMENTIGRASLRAIAREDDAAISGFVSMFKDEFHLVDVWRRLTIEALPYVTMEMLPHYMWDLAPPPPVVPK